MQEREGPSIDIALLATLVLAGGLLAWVGWTRDWHALAALGALGPAGAAAFLAWVLLAHGDPGRQPRVGQALFALLVLYSAIIMLAFLVLAARVGFALLRDEEVDGRVLLLVGLGALPLFVQVLAAVLGVVRRGLERRDGLRLALRWAFRLVGLSVFFGLPLGLLAFLYFVSLGGRPEHLPWLYGGTATTVLTVFAVWFWRERLGSNG